MFTTNYASEKAGLERRTLNARPVPRRAGPGSDLAAGNKLVATVNTFDQDFSVARFLP